MNTRIAIADDHPMVINGVRDMLADFPNIQITGAYLDIAMLFDGLRAEQPDVLLLDIQMPGKTGDEALPGILKLYPGLRILILTNFDNTIYVNNLLSNGAYGYLLKNTDQRTLLEAIETVNRGEQFLKPEMKDRLEAYRSRSKRTTSSRFALTPREKEILKLIISGNSNHEIAEILSLSLRTVENYRLNLSLKLEVKNTAGLVRKGIELGIHIENQE
jgi:DNA-binding NarL/FixJ family response regulator